MRRSSAFIWREARRQIANFPDCPADLSEPQYANVAFYPHFYVCVHEQHSSMHSGQLTFEGCKKESGLLSGFLGSVLLNMSENLVCIEIPFPST